MRNPEDMPEGRSGRQIDPESPSPGLVTGLVAGFVAGVVLVAAQPGIGERLRDVAGEFAPFTKARSEEHTSELQSH